MSEITASTGLATLHKAVDSVCDTMTNDQVLEVRERLIFALGDCRALVKELDAAMIEWMKANGDLRVNEDKRLYVGHDKRIKCNDPAATIEALMTATDGDFGAVTDCLSSSPFKHGACRRPLGDTWDEHFTTTTVDKVKVKEADAKFAKRLRKD